MQDPALAKAEWQPATITEIVRRTPRVTSFFLQPSKPLAYRPGQHVDLRLSAPDGYQTQRSYSIASTPEQGEIIELAIERLDDGEVSSFFHDIAIIGDEIELRGPIGGHFIWTVEDGAPILLIGGGSGVAPLISMVRHRAAQQSLAPILLLYSARTAEELIFHDELLAFKQSGNGFDLALTLTREPNSQASEYTRRIDPPMIADMLERLPSPPKEVFVCGSNAFVTAAADALIAANIPAGIIRTERYGNASA
ncbi:ferredoxin reductase [Phyllobacterium endophyticum]|uniref:Oxidoreductase n=1 Tax=Phyllobacterium endophyticum TaxID=1149773 RepID=A0A2P7AM72_9HYPH|nr:ferredoxin reductase [Phyllobacterium endophyticum]MBB3238505.1 ferredoxin-NADP reductase [Phyllobacterium endophyticum]PSH55297.1 oxidoreductase [Phyllobacterium endophyticum]TYR43169.1 oxidoreductase [Phyllobacterium endophyticum]